MTTAALQETNTRITVAGYELAVRQLHHPAKTDAPGPVLVFLHEALGCITQWRDFPEALAMATGCDALIYDRPGHGRSAPLKSLRKPDYLSREALDILPTLIEELNISRIILVGHSDGASIALLFAAAFPEMTAAAICEAAHVFVEEITLKGIRAAVENYYQSDVPEKLARHHGKNTEPMVKAWYETWLSAAFRHWDITDILPQITAPLLLLQGTDDEYGTTAQLDAIANGVHGPSEIHLLTECSHTPHRQQRETTLAKMARFISTILSPNAY